MGRAIQVEPLLAGMTDTSGTPLASGQVYFYRAGSSTQRDVYSTATRSTTVTQPVTLDAAGRALVYADGMYRMVVQDSEGNTIYDWDDLRFYIGESTNWYGTVALANDNNFFSYVYPAPTEYNAGDRYILQVETVNKDSPKTTSVWPRKPTTININGLGERNLLYNTTDDDGYIQPWTFSSGQTIQIVYDGASFIVVNADQAYWSTTAFEYSATGGMTVTRVANSSYEFYRVLGRNTMEIFFAPVLTLAGSASEYISFSLPSYFGIEPASSSSGVYHTGCGWSSVERADGTTYIPGFCIIENTANEFRIYNYDGSVYPLETISFGGMITFRFQEI